MNYYGLLEADFLTTNLSFENTDLDILPAGQKSQLLLWGANIVFTEWTEHLVKDSQTFQSQIPALEQKNSTLRC
jgi:hypothetical protein